MPRQIRPDIRFPPTTNIRRAPRGIVNYTFREFSAVGSDSPDLTIVLPVRSSGRRGQMALPMRNETHHDSKVAASGWIAILAIGLSLCAGCYDGEAMVKEAQSVALKTRLAEVDL